MRASARQLAYGDRGRTIARPLEPLIAKPLALSGDGGKAIAVQANHRTAPAREPRRAAPDHRPRIANLLAAAWLLAGLVAIPVATLALTAPVHGGVTVTESR